jgi:hypothetical protein
MHLFSTSPYKHICTQCVSPTLPKNSTHAKRANVLMGGCSHKNVNTPGKVRVRKWADGSAVIVIVLSSVIYERDERLRRRVSFFSCSKRGLRNTFTDPRNSNVSYSHLRPCAAICRYRSKRQTHIKARTASFLPASTLACAKKSEARKRTCKWKRSCALLYSNACVCVRRRACLHHNRRVKMKKEQLVRLLK